MSVRVLFHHPDPSKRRTQEYPDSQAAIEALWDKDNESTGALVRVTSDGTYMMLRDRNEAMRAERINNKTRLLRPNMAFDLWRIVTTIAAGEDYRVVFEREVLSLKEMPGPTPKG